MKKGAIPSLRWLKVTDIKIPEGRLHSHFDDHSDFEESIKAEGVIQPIHVCEDKDGVYWLADGQNRLEALKSQGKLIIPAYVWHGSKQDAVLFSAKLNVLRGEVNVGEFAEYVLNLKERYGMTVEDIAKSIGRSKGHVSKLLAVAQNRELLEKVRKGELSLKEAYERLESFTVKPISQETIHEAESFPGKQKSEVTRQPLTDEDLGITTNLKQAMEEGKRFKPLSPDDLKAEAEPRKTEYMTCDYCGRLLSRL
ncbi:MAG: ParB/RepB/Spo0J family partition protein, partial [Candidatus Bathyarchaeia archaeon]